MLLYRRQPFIARDPDAAYKLLIVLQHLQVLCYLVHELMATCRFRHFSQGTACLHMPAFCSHAGYSSAFSQQVLIIAVRLRTYPQMLSPALMQGEKLWQGVAEPSSR